MMRHHCKEIGAAWDSDSPVLHQLGIGFRASTQITILGIERMRHRFPVRGDRLPIGGQHKTRKMPHYKEAG